MHFRLCMKRWLSYLGPIRLKTVDSTLHQDLHIALDSGKKVLHAGNVNYSYGPLQHILEEGLRQILPMAAPGPFCFWGWAPAPSCNPFGKSSSFRRPSPRWKSILKWLKLPSTNFKSADSKTYPSASIRPKTIFPNTPPNSI